MRLADLLTGPFAGRPDVPDPASLNEAAGALEILGVTDDSREVRPGFLFIARPGVATDGARFITDARRLGAVAILGNPAALRGLPPGVVGLQTEDPAHAGAALIERHAGDPSAKLNVIGVTGTNGKTTTSFLIQSLLRAAGRRAALISTVRIDDGASVTNAAMTTPGAGALSHALARAALNGCDSAVVETSSHALDQKRVAGLRYRVGVFTNLTGDHLDYHKTMDAYADAKARLFDSLPGAHEGGVAVVNADDPWHERMLRDCRARIFACSLGGGGLRGSGATWSRCVVEAGEPGPSGAPMSLRGAWGEAVALVPLVGPHNAMNALQAAAAAFALGVSSEAIADGLRRAPSPPGRLEPVRMGDAQPFAVYVDYAHTDDALTRALTAVRPLVGRGGRLICVFGAGGDKDRTKRPRMGAAVAAAADIAFVTSDNPRTEDPRSIIEMILQGMPERMRGAAIIEPERESAIHAAIADARPGDVIVIAGKGHEDYQILPDGAGGTIRREFDDRRVAMTALERRFCAAGATP